MTQQPPLGRPPYGYEDPYRAWSDDTAPQAAAPRPAPRRRPRQRQRQSRLVPLLLGLTVFLGLIIAAVTGFLVFALPTSVVRNYIVAEVKAQTGRDLLVEGPSSFTLLPNVNVVFNNVTLLGAPGSGGPTVTMESLAVRVQTLPLLSRRVVIDRLVLREPVLDLRTDKSGRKSWQIAPSTPPPARPAEPEAAEAVPAKAGTAMFKDFGAAKLARLDQLELGRLFIKNGTVRYRDERTGARSEVRAVDLRIGMTSLLSAVHLAGSVAWGGEKLSVRGSLDSVRDVLEGRSAALTFNIGGRPVTAAYEGTVALKEGFDLRGTVQAEGPSSTDFSAWLGRKLPASAGGPFSLSGQVKAGRNTVELSPATLSIGIASATGTVSVDTTGTRPYVKADLRIAELDLDRASAAADEAASAPATKDAGDTQARPLSLPKSIEDLIQDEGPRVKGYKKAAGWSEKPLALERFDVVDADATLAIGRLRVRDLEVGQSLVKVALRDRVLKAEFADAPFYGGRARGSVTLDARDDTAAGIAADLHAEGVAARQLLDSAADVDWLAGTGKLSLVLTGRGGTERQIVDSLAGNASVHIGNGAFYGWNLTELLDKLRQGHFNGLDRSPDAKTDFTELAGSFAIAGGVATNSDLRLASPQLQVAGTGKLHLGERRMDYMLTPKLVVSSGAQKSLISIEVPVRVDGPWQHPRFAPEVPAALADPEKARDTLREIRKSLKGKSAGDIVKGLLGDGQDGEIKVKPKKLMELLKPNAQQQPATPPPAAQQQQPAAPRQ